MLPEVNLGTLREVTLLWLAKAGELEAHSWPLLIEMVEIIAVHDDKYSSQQFFLDFMQYVDTHIYGLEVQDLARLFIVFKLRRDDSTFSLVKELEQELLMKLDSVCLENHAYLLRLYLLVPLVHY